MSINIHFSYSRYEKLKKLHLINTNNKKDDKKALISVFISFLLGLGTTILLLNGKSVPIHSSMISCSKEMIPAIPSSVTYKILVLILILGLPVIIITFTNTNILLIVSFYFALNFDIYF